MVISTTTTKNTYTGNGATTSYAASFPFPTTNSVKAKINGSVTTAFTLTPGSIVDGHYENGTVVFNSAPANGAAIVIYREFNLTQEILDTGVSNTVDASDLEEILDEVVMAGQDNRRIASDAASDAAADILADVQALVDAAEAAQAAAELAETNAETAETNAETAETNAEAAEVAAEAAQALAEAAADSAVSIANGDLFAFVSKTGNFTAANNGAYLVDDGAQITMPAIGANVNFRIVPKTSFTTGVTFLYTSNAINGYSENVTINTTEGLAIYSANASTWVIVRDFAPVVNVVNEFTSSTKTTDYTLTTDDDQIIFNITAQSTLLTYAAATTTKPHYITNKETSTQKLVINPNGSETVNGQSTFDVFPGQSFILRSDGTNWRLY